MNPQASGRFGRLPPELLASPQWCIAGPDKAPYVVGSAGVNRASIHKREHYRDFDTCTDDMVRAQAPYLGYVITYDDPFTCIDLDVCNAYTQQVKGEPNDPSKWTTIEQMERFKLIVDTFDSYTEISTLGWGLHIWVKGKIGAGAKRDGVEIYSQERFIICTGNVYCNKPIGERQELLEAMVSQMRIAGNDGKVELIEEEETESDAIVWDRALTAANKEKVQLLVEGNWKQDYPSQSEADLALMSIFCFYTKSNEQVRRLFRFTALGQRDKATKNNRYLDYTLEVIRGRQAREAIIDIKGIEMAAALVAQIQNSDFADVAAANIASVTLEPPIDMPGELAWPPGLTGALATFIYNSSPRPVKEVAIVAALGFIAGVVGKSYNIPQSGLNVYIILVARSGVGKEAMHSGLSLVCEELRETTPLAQHFVDFNEFASGPALIKACATNPSFLNVSGEWGRKLKRLADDTRVDGPMATLRTQMTNLYQKSGAGNMTGGLTYSKKEDNIGSVTGVAYSMIGETTPGTFYDSLTPGMMEDGFLSRFIIVEYTGTRPELNYNAIRKMPPELAQALHGITNHSLELNSKYLCELVTYDREAGPILMDFDKVCTAKINGSQDESVRQMWNRAHLKVARVASLLAAADNWLKPVVNKGHALWALDLIKRDINIMSTRMASGDIGVDDDARQRKLIDVIRKFLTEGPGSDAYKCPDGFYQNGLIPKRYIQIRLNGASQFSQHKQGATKALDETLKSLLENGLLQEMDKSFMAEKHNYHGRTFRILNLPKR